MSAADQTGNEPPATSRWVHLYALVPLVAGCAAAGLAVLDPVRLSLGPINYAGVPLIAAGLVLVAWTVLAFARAGETLSPVTQPDGLVTAGPLAWTRNPMYLGVVTAVAGVAVLAGSPVVAAYAAVLAVGYHAIVVTVEEPELERAFGETYQAYRARVPRWVPHRR